MLADLFTEAREVFDEGAVLLRRFCAVQEAELYAVLQTIIVKAPFRRMATPGGHAMSAGMTNCGTLGWVTDRKGYRYTTQDPQTGLNWPPMPEMFSDLAKSAADTAGYENFMPDACLINAYEAGAKMALHQDRDEQDFAAPIVSISLGLPAVFLWGGKTRAEKPRRISLISGDVLVWGGKSRLNFHGILPVKAGCHSIFGNRRINLTFRMAG